ncbi:MAG TPA: putative sulfate exporter family transporter [Jatrophihabitans sp.]|nr:putative sulfate exporter family transporter [Jatrophihabitans sp.]
MSRVNRHPALLAPGLLLCLAIAAMATAGGSLVPIVGAPIIGLVAGVVLRVAFRMPSPLVPGVDSARGFVLQCAVVLLGSQLSLTQVARVGVGSLPVMLGTLVACLAMAYLVGRRLGIDSDLCTLIGVGTAICGASAIAAVSPVIRARSNQIAYAVSTIFGFNIVAVLVFPPLGHALGMNQQAFGLFAGTAVNDTSSVVAAASVYGHSATEHAVVIKLVRTLMIIPICLALAALVRRRDARADGGQTGTRLHLHTLVPWFLVGFLLMAAANSGKLVPTAAHPALAQLSLFGITTALAAIGLSTDLAELRRTGSRPLLLGLILWVTVSVTSLLLQWAT